MSKSREAKKSDFIGKTIKKVNVRGVNYWLMEFTDGTVLGIAVEHMGAGEFGIIVYPEAKK